MRLEGQVAGITGAASGIGRATALAFAREGADVAVCDLNQAGLDDTAARIRQYGSRAYVRAVDVTATQSLQSFVDDIVEEFERLDIWVGNAGMSGTGPAEDLTEEQWNQVFDLNVHAVFLGAQAAGRHMLAQGSGSIINTASMYGIRAMAGRIAYCTSKAAVVMLSQALAVEWAARGVRVNAIAPGYSDTELFRNGRELTPAILETTLAEVPMGRLVNPEEIAECCVFLGSNESAAVTGHVLTVDAGWTAAGR